MAPVVEGSGGAVRTAGSLAIGHRWHSLAGTECSGADHVGDKTEQGEPTPVLPHMKT